MKKLTTILIIVATISSIFAQTPNSFKYQTVVRNATGVVLPNQDISFQISILQSSATGTAVYTETHLVTTNDFGLVNLNIGAGTTSDDFSTIDWSNGPFFIKVELDENGGTAYAEMGTAQLLSVPYAMYANDVANKDDADADPNNELQIMNFSNDTLYLDNGGQVYLGEYSSLWGQNDTNIYYNNGWVGVGTETPSGMMVVQGDEGVNPDSAIFEVKNKEGQTIFAVYDGGVRIWVDDTGAKSNTDKGGFAVGGYRLNKSISSEYLRVTPDSVRVYIREDDGTKANTDKGGFAVGGYRLNKSTTSEYFNINPNLNADTLNPSEARIYWYPLKEAFMSGRVLVESVDSVGLNSWATGYESKSIGDYSQALGYSARAKGDNSTAIGNYAFAKGDNSFALGDSAIATGIASYAIGAVARDTLGNPLSFSTLASGNYSFAIGNGAKSTDLGALSFGSEALSTGKFSIAMGVHSKAYKDYAVAIGKDIYNNGKYGVAIGQADTVGGDNSISIGVGNNAAGTHSIAMGTNNVAGGLWGGGVSIGSQNNAGGFIGTGFAIGNSCYSTALGVSMSFGMYDTTYGRNCFAFGERAIVGSPNGTSLSNSALFNMSDINNEVTEDNVFSIMGAKVGIGTTSPDYNLHVVGSPTLASILIAPNESTSGGDAELLLAEDDEYDYGMSLFYDGGLNQLQVKGKSGTTNYGPWLTISRNDGKITMPAVYNDAVGSTNRDLYIDNTGLIGYLSSARRFKKQIKTMENVDWLYKLRPVNYLYKADKNGIKQYGLIAEEVEAINPLFVSYNKEGVIETVNYSQLITPMLKAIQDLKQENIELKGKISEIDVLKAEIEQLKQILEVKAEK